MTRLLDVARQLSALLALVWIENHASCAFKAANPGDSRVHLWTDEQDLIIGLSAELSNAHRRRMDNH